MPAGWDMLYTYGEIHERAMSYLHSGVSGLCFFGILPGGIDINEGPPTTWPTYVRGGKGR